MAIPFSFTAGISLLVVPGLLSFYSDFFELHGEVIIELLEHFDEKLHTAKNLHKTLIKRFSV